MSKPGVQIKWLRGWDASVTGTGGRELWRKTASFPAWRETWVRDASEQLFE